MLRYLDIIRYRIYVDVRNELYRSHMGLFWWLLEPAMYLAAFYFVFETIFQRGGPGFVCFLLIGLIFWRWFDNSVKRSAGSILANAGLIKQVNLPKMMYPVAELGSALVRFLFVLPILFAFLWFYQGKIHSTSWYLPLLMLVQITLAAGVSTLLAALIPFATDLRKLLDHGLMLMFYMSGIFFDIARAPEHLQKWLYMNPMATLIAEYRNILVEGQSPNFFAIGIIFISSLALLAISMRLIRKFEAVYARILA